MCPSTIAGTLGPRPCFRRRRREVSILRRTHPSQAGITLLEMLVVVIIIGLMIGIAVPAFQAGLPSIRLRGASSSVAQLLQGARNQMERNQVAVLVEVDPAKRWMRYRSATGEIGEELEMPTGIEISGVAPLRIGEPVGRREFLFLPGGAPPEIAVELRNERGGTKTIWFNPITTTPIVDDKPIRGNQPPNAP